MLRQLTITTSGQGLYEITAEVDRLIAEAGTTQGLCTLLIQHTSASLLIQENADPTARRDLETWLSRLVPEDDPLYTHTLEGPDDMPAHIKAALTASTLSIPIAAGRLALGTWQGVYLWEHRRGRASRRILIHILADND